MPEACSKHNGRRPFRTSLMHNRNNALRLLKPTIHNHRVGPILTRVQRSNSCREKWPWKLRVGSCSNGWPASGRVGSVCERLYSKQSRALDKALFRPRRVLVSGSTSGFLHAAVMSASKSHPRLSYSVMALSFNSSVFRACRTKTLPPKMRSSPIPRSYSLHPRLRLSHPP